MSQFVGKWKVQIPGRWTWIYTLNPNGSASWADTSNGMTGNGTWKGDTNRVDFKWAGSSTREYWDKLLGDGRWGGKAYMTAGVFDISATKVVTDPVFVIPAGGPVQAGKYTAQGQLWRIDVEATDQIVLGLKNPAGLKVTSNNPRVADVGAGRPEGGVMMIPILGISPGNAMIEAKTPVGQVATYLQVEVRPATSNYGLIAQGPAALSKVAEIIKATKNLPAPGPFPTPFGPILLKKGGVWDGTKMIVHTDHQHTIYVVDDKLYKATTADFARNLFLDPITKKMKEAKWMVVVTKVLMSFIQGLLVGPVVIVISKVAVIGLWIGAHPQLAQQGIDGLIETQRAASLIKQRYPTLWARLRNALLLHAAASIPDALVETVRDPETVAFFLGRILQGLKDAPSITFSVFLKIVAKCAAIIAGLHLAPSVVHVQVNRVKHLADQLKTEFNKPDINVALTQSEALKMAEELLKYSDSGKNLDDLNKSTSKWVTVLDTLYKDLEDNK